MLCTIYYEYTLYCCFIWYSLVSNNRHGFPSENRPSAVHLLFTSIFKNFGKTIHTICKNAAASESTTWPEGTKGHVCLGHANVALEDATNPIGPKDNATSKHPVSSKHTSGEKTLAATSEECWKAKLETRLLQVYERKQSLTKWFNDRKSHRNLARNSCWKLTVNILTLRCQHMRPRDSRFNLTSACVALRIVFVVLRDTIWP